MNTRYIDLIEQTFEFPQEEFNTEKGKLFFHGIDLLELVKEYGAPLKFTYLPKITENIQKARNWFAASMKKLDYNANYYYCYCTKSSHFNFILEEALKNKVQIETSSAFDIDIVKNLYKKGKLTKDTFILCNGFKRNQYILNIASLINDGFKNCIPIIDNYEELDLLLHETNKKFKVGIRIASEEEPKFEFYTSRLGIGYKNIVNYYKNEIATNPQVELKMLHFFINT